MFMQRFLLIRSEDPSGCSGTGVVAEGVVWSAGHVNLNWLVEPFSESRFPSVDALLRVHGHGGRTVLQVLDQPVPGYVEEEPTATGAA